MMATFCRVDSLSANPVIAREVRQNPLIISAVLVGLLCNPVFYGAVLSSVFSSEQITLIGP
jgi:DHA2 family methylenomycin A resistance protein-like MFS transporter